MSTLINTVHAAAHTIPLREAMVEDTVAAAHEARGWNRDRFAQEQIRNLVRQVFFSGSAKASRHVVFCAVDESTYVAEICVDAAKTLAAQVQASVCVIEANSQTPDLEKVYGGGHEASGSGREGPGFLRNSSLHLSDGLWLAPRHLLMGQTNDGRSPLWLERRLSDFRLEFDYTLLHAPPVTRQSDAILLSRICDGVVLVLEADGTRRAAAHKAKESLISANARLLGVVLSERTFPIPEELYRRL